MGGRRKAPDFPNCEKCLAMLRKRDAMTQEEGYHTLLPQVSQYVGPLRAALATEEDPHMQSWLLELLGEAHSPSALSIFARYLEAEREDLRRWAQDGIGKLAETSEGRRVLWDAQLGVEAPLADLAADDLERRHMCVAEVLETVPRHL